MKKTQLFLSALLLFPVSLCARFVVGTYDASGYDADLQPYTGTVEIDRVSEEVLSISWTFDDGTTASGSGVRQDNALSFSYSSGDTHGTQAYKIRAHGNLLEGPFVDNGETTAGYERLIKRHCS